MTAYVRPPNPLSEDGNMSQNWQSWKKYFLNYLKVTNSDKKSEDIKTYLLRMYIGNVGQDAIDKIVSTDKIDKNNLQILLKKLDTFFEPSKNEIVERYNFFSTFRKKNESIEKYICNLKEKATTCNFGDMMDSLIRDKVISELKDKNLQKKLFETEKLDLLKLISIYNEHKPMNIQEKTQDFKKDIANDKGVKGTANNNNSRIKNTTKQNQSTEFKKCCWRCNQTHARNSCTARGFKCQKCGDYNHYTNCCRSIPANQEQKVTNEYKFETNTMHRNVLNPNVTVQTPNSMPIYMQSNSIIEPSAPQLHDNDNMLYPNLYDVQTSTENSRSNEWSWVNQGNIKTNENFVRLYNEQPINAPERQYTTRKTTAINTKDKRDSCKIS